MSILNTKTAVNISGSNISIYIWYQKCLGYINFWINGASGAIDGVSFIEGQLGYKVDQVDDLFFLNTSGELIVQSDNPDKYSVDSNGNLLTNIDFCGVAIPDPSVKYGVLYNWYDVISVNPIYAVNAHVPTYNEVLALIQGIDPIGDNQINTAGGHLKEVGTNHWLIPNTGATDDYGFSMKGSGTRSYTNGVFSYLKVSAYIWTSSTFTSGASGVGFQFMSNNNRLSFGNVNPKSGYSVRLIVDSPIEIAGSNAVYVGNNGYRYKCVLINGVWWTAENLAETLYRDGSAIPKITDNIEWYNLGASIIQPTHNATYVSYNSFGGLGTFTHGQTFTVSAISRLSEIILLKPSNISTANFNVRLSIYNISGGLPTTKICDSINVVPANYLSTSVVFKFDNQILPSGQYAFVTSYENMVLNTDTDIFEIHASTVNPYSGGSLLIYYSGSWHIESTYDLVFTINFLREAICAYNNDDTNIFETV